MTGGSYGTNGSGYATLAYDATTGNRLWLKRYDFKDYDNSSSARSVTVSLDGETVFVTGFSDGGPTDWDYATIAYDAATGATSWEKRYNDPPGDDQDAANALVLSPDGRTVFVTGESRGLVRNYDYATLAYAAVTGRRQWVKRYNGPSNGDDYSESIAVSQTERACSSLAGATSQTLRATTRIAYEAGTGAKRFAKRYNAPFDSRDSATSIAASPDGSQVFVTGSSLASASLDDFATIAYRA